MVTQRTRTARDLVALAGRWPNAAIALSVLQLFVTTGTALAQSGAPVGHVNAAQPGQAAQPAKPRDPMKAPKDEKSDAKVTVSEHMTVDLHVKDEDLSNVLELLSIQTQKNIIASKNVGAKVTATLYGVTFYQALDSILHVNGFGYIENGNFIYVYTNDELKQIEAALKKRVSKVIRLSYLNADDAKEFVSPLLSKDGGEIKINSKPVAFTIPDKAPVGKNDYAMGDTLVVIDFEENIKAIEELVKQIDTKPAQVLVEATILQTALNEANAFGVDFSVIGDLNFVDFLNVGGALGAANALIRGGNGASGSGFTPPNDRGNAVTSTPGNTSGPGTFKVGVLAGDVAIFLRMLDQVTDSVVLSNPKILALNRQPARVLVGKRVGYLNTTATETSTTQTVEFLDTGTQLYFRPFVSTDGEVRMELKPQVSAAEIRNVTDARGSTVTIPDEVTQELVTNVIVKDGQTVVLGGLFTESSSFTRRQVPWIGDIPILGAAFRGNDDTTQRSEIIFLITPTIISDPQLSASAERASADIDRVRAGSRQGLLPWSREKMTDQLNVEAEKFAREGDYDKAMWNIQRSLSLNSQQPEAYRLRERITGQREHWSDPSMLNAIVNSEMNKRLEAIKPAEGTIEVPLPKGHIRVPTEPVTRPINTAPGSNKSVVGPSNENQPIFAGAGEGPQSSTSFNPPASGELNSSTGTSDVVATLPAEQNQANSNSAANANFSANLDAVHTAQSTENTVSSTGDSSGDLTNASITAQNEQHNQVATTTNEPSVASPELNNAPSIALAEPVQMNAPAAHAVEQPAHELNHEPAGQATQDTAAPQTAWTTPGALALEVQAEVQKHSTPSGEHASTDAPASLGTSINVGSSTPAANPAVTPAVTPVVTPVVNVVDDVRKSLNSVRGQVELYSLMNKGTLPALGFDENDGWAPLTETNLLKQRPQNAYIGGANSDKVIVRETADTSYHNDYGWIFNPKTGQVWAAGFDASDKPISKDVKPTAQTSPDTQVTPGQPSASAEHKATAADMINAIKGKSKSAQNQPSSTTANAEAEPHK